MPNFSFADSRSQTLVERCPGEVHVAVLLGGPPHCTERDISLKSGAAVAQALREAGYRVSEVEVKAEALPPLPAGVDVIFPVLHGAFGEDGGIQSLLEARGLPYVGSGPEACRTMMDKQAAKRIVAAAGVPAPAGGLVTDPEADVPPGLSFPLIVKPNGQGSSVAIHRLRKMSGWWRRSLRNAFRVDRSVLVEEYIEGREITVGILDGTPLPVIEIVPPKGRIFDHDAKYEHRRGRTRYLCPPEKVSPAICEHAGNLALRCWEALGGKDMARIDFIVDKGGTPWFLEANAIPGFTGTSLLPKAAAAAGIVFPELCARLVRLNLNSP